MKGNFPNHNHYFEKTRREACNSRLSKSLISQKSYLISNSPKKHKSQQKNISLKNREFDNNEYNNFFGMDCFIKNEYSYNNSKKKKKFSNDSYQECNINKTNNHFSLYGIVQNISNFRLLKIFFKKWKNKTKNSIKIKSIINMTCDDSDYFNVDSEKKLTDSISCNTVNISEIHENDLSLYIPEDISEFNNYQFLFPSADCPDSVIPFQKHDENKKKINPMLINDIDNIIDSMFSD